MTDIFADAFKDIVLSLQSMGDPDATTATYQPVSGAAVADVLIHIEKGIDLQPPGFATRVVSQSKTIEAALSDLGKEPSEDETFTTTAGTVYTVLSVIENDGHTVKVHVK